MRQGFVKECLSYDCLFNHCGVAGNWFAQNAVAQDGLVDNAWWLQDVRVLDPTRLIKCHFQFQAT